MSELFEKCKVEINVKDNQVGLVPIEKSDKSCLTPTTGLFESYLVKIYIPDKPIEPTIEELMIESMGWEDYIAYLKEDPSYSDSYDF